MMRVLQYFHTPEEPFCIFKELVVFMPLAFVVQRCFKLQSITGELFAFEPSEYLSPHITPRLR